jgi:anti-sigma factor RsiW
VALGANLPYLLADALHLQSLDQIRPERERQNERRERAQDRARREVAEHVEARVELRQIFGGVEEH